MAGTRRKHSPPSQQLSNVAQEAGGKKIKESCLMGEQGLRGKADPFKQTVALGHLGEAADATVGGRRVHAE